MSLWQVVSPVAASSELQKQLLSFTASWDEACDHADDDTNCRLFLTVTKEKKAKLDELYVTTLLDTKTMLDNKEKEQKKAIDDLRSVAYRCCRPFPKYLEKRLRVV